MSLMKTLIYTKTGCPWAAGAKAFLDAKGIHFEERNMTENSAFKEEAEKETGQCASPTLNIGGTWVPDAGLDDINTQLKKAS